jgi:hypothetical protein
MSLYFVSLAKTIFVFLVKCERSFSFKFSFCSWLSERPSVKSADTTGNVAASKGKFLLFLIHTDKCKILLV